MKTILLLLSLSLIWRGSWKDEDGNFSLPYTISFILAIVAEYIIVFGNVVE